MVIVEGNSRGEHGQIEMDSISAHAMPRSVSRRERELVVVCGILFGCSEMGIIINEEILIRSSDVHPTNH
jgi:hypothetical protein